MKNLNREISDESLLRLGRQLEGEIHLDLTTRKLYATDASPYEQLPRAVAIVKNADDIQKLIHFCDDQVRQQIAASLIPRAAGTSLAGQVVGRGIIVDVTRHMNQILEVDVEQKTAWVQPGVIRDELNRQLEPHGLFFGPETSTSNRATISGMFGNNSCGSNSIRYGNMRDHVLETIGFLADGTEAHFRPVESLDDVAAKASDSVVKIYEALTELLTPQAREEIARCFPHPEIPRRNTGYALDALATSQPFVKDGRPLNLCRLIAGSEGTLFFSTAIRLQLRDCPPPEQALVGAHFDSVDEALHATSIAVEHPIETCELIDRHVLDGAARNTDQRENLDFVVGSPKAILVVGFRSDSEQRVLALAERLIAHLKTSALGYAFPILTGRNTSAVWALRKAGLGVVANVPGDAKPVTVIEDTAVKVTDLPSYIGELNRMLIDRFGASCVHYAHAGAGELHLRPVLNLKTKEGRRDFRLIAEETAELVKRYRGSLSGEHGDGRLRSEFIEQMVGESVFQMLRRVKQIWDPHNIFNPGKIVDAPPMDVALRYPNPSPAAGASDPPGGRVTGGAPETMFRFPNSLNALQASELCVGSGDCLKTHFAGGTMCPSYMATRNESDSTRGRANIVRQALTHPEDHTNPLADSSIESVMSNCLSCKACKSECPANVDIARLKAEAAFARHRTGGVPLRSRIIASQPDAMRWAARARWAYNAMTQTSFTARMVNRISGFHPQVRLPKLSKTTLRHWFRRRQGVPPTVPRGSVYLFCDEFTNYFDVDVGIAAIELLERFGFRVLMPPHRESGRAALSQGLLNRAQKCAEANVRTFATLATPATPLVGIEPSALLAFRDEYPDLVGASLRDDAIALAKNTRLIDEFLVSLVEQSVMSPADFSTQPSEILLHGHCHQKALSSMSPSVRLLSLPENFTVTEIPSGCCGMAGAFGYQREHYELSMQIGELILFPAIRESFETNRGSSPALAATGMSCRHQIARGTGREALHPVQILARVLGRAIVQRSK